MYVHKRDVELEGGAVGAQVTYRHLLLAWTNGTVGAERGDHLSIP